MASSCCTPKSKSISWESLSFSKANLRSTSRAGPLQRHPHVSRSLHRQDLPSEEQSESLRVTSSSASDILFLLPSKNGFLKAFSDQPEQFTFGLSPLQTVLQQLKLREVIIYPRFHAEVDRDLKKRKADVIEMYQPLSNKMAEIQAAIIECMEATLSEIKRSNTYVRQSLLVYSAQLALTSHPP